MNQYNYCIIKENKVYHNGKLIFNEEEIQFSKFSKKVYKFLDINYPKFFKMDELSKLAILGAELLLKENVNKDTALVFMNKYSSLETDITYQKTIQEGEDYFPSPAVFVYTLPNICMGEVAIKHQLRSENIFFIENEFNIELVQKYSNNLLDTKKASSVLISWVEYFNGKYELFMYLLDDKNKELNNIEKLYKQKI